MSPSPLSSHSRGVPWLKYLLRVLHTVVLGAALLPALGMGDGIARVAPIAMVVLWIVARPAGTVLRSIYSALVGVYAAITLTVAIWPWVNIPGWAVIAAIVGVGALAFLTVRAKSWRNGALAYSAMAIPLIGGFLFALTVANPFIRHWSRVGL